VPRLGAEFVQQILLGLRRRLLPVSETRFLETTHQTGLSFFPSISVFAAQSLTASGAAMPPINPPQ
jgi:hypothetical protein